MPDNLWNNLNSVKCLGVSMKLVRICFLSSLLLVGCSGGGGGSEDSANAQGGGTVIVSAQVNSDIQEELQAQPQYQLDLSEIELLYSEGAITEEQKQELLALLQ